MNTPTVVKAESVLTEEFRLSFNSLFQAKANMNGIVRHEMEMLFPKDRGSAQFTNLATLYNKTIKKFEGTDGPVPRTFREAIISGDKKKQEGRHGMFLLRANSGADYPPRLLLPNGKRAAPAELYEGCWARAILTCYPYIGEKDGRVVSRGAAFNILTVQKTRDDQHFSQNRVSEEEQDELLRANPLPNSGTSDSMDDLDLLS